MLKEEALDQLIQQALTEDVGPGDFSTLSCIPPDISGKAILKIKEQGILAGVEVAKRIFHFIEPGCKFENRMQDGDVMQPNDIVFQIDALIHTILKAERLVLNCMQRMSGIATLTHAYTEKLKNYHTRLLDTRKTTPNFRLLEKEAVKIGGGYNHRMGLYDMIMLKDNHIDYCGGIENAIRATNEYLERNHLSLLIEVETRNIKEIKKVIKTGKVKRIMFDNFAPDEVKKAVRLIDGQFETEASGGITLDNLVAYAQTGVDYISAGSVIHHAVSLDLSLKAVFTS
jgi:nicotinate-nucleotide pyrophosphorylase (carboxylating)